MLYVKKVGVSTTCIRNVDKMADILVEKKLYATAKSVGDRDAINTAILEADAQKISKITVGAEMNDAIKAESFSQALKMVQEESVIICIQKGQDDYQDAAAVVVTPNEPDTALAVIASASLREKGERARILDLYQQNGPVADAISVIECCISKKYGLDLKKDWSGEIFLDEDYDKDLPLNCTLSDTILVFRQFKSKTDGKREIKQLIIPVTFEKDDLQNKIDILKKNLSETSISDIVREYILSFIKTENREKTVVFCGSNRAELEMEIQLFLKERKQWYSADFYWHTKRGSCYVSAPSAENAKICYLNPPGGLFSKVQFYKLYRSFSQLKKCISTDNIGNMSSDEMISRYYFEIMTILFTVKALKMAGITQDAVIGGSLGELSVPLVFDIMAPNKQFVKKINISNHIKHEVIHMLEEIIASQKELSRIYFGRAVANMEKWYLVCDYELVKREIKSMPEKVPVFITIIGSPRDIIICGTHEMCMNMITKLHCYATKFQDPIYAHTPVLEPKYSIIKERLKETGIHLDEKLPYDIYRTYKKEKMGHDIEAFAENFADCIVKQVNMPDVLKRAYEDGCRIFIDLGSGMLCSKWAKETFKNNKEVKVLSPFDKKTSEESILSIVSICMANGIEMNYKQFLNWYLCGNQAENRQEISNMNDKTDSCWKKEFMKAVVLEQLKRNSILFDKYLEYEKKVLESALEDNEKREECLFDYEQILEMTGGSMAKVLGSVYQDVDKYNIRARMPLPPYMFVSRILSINAKYGEFKAGSFIEAEYDVPYDCIMRVNEKNVSSVVFSEAAHIGIFLAGYMGIDSFSSGKSKFRITDVTTKYVSDKWPQIKDTIKMKFVIDRVIRNGDITLLICTYKVYLKDELIIDAKETGGFFDQLALDSGSGIQSNKPADIKDSDLSKHPVYQPVMSKQIFEQKDVQNFLSGKYINCFGRDIVNSITPYQVCKEAMFIDKITAISETDGKYGLGYIVAEKEIDSSYWPFRCHFKNDPVLPGTVMLEGLSQALTFFQTYMGLYNTDKPFVTKMKTGNTVQTKFRGEVKCASHKLIYKVYPKEVRLMGEELLFVADGEVYCDGLQVIEQKNASMLIVQQ